MYNGWTPTTPTETQARNLSVQLIERAGKDDARAVVVALLQKHGGVCPEFVRELGGVVRSEMAKEAHE